MTRRDDRPEARGASPGSTPREGRGTVEDPPRRSNPLESLYQELVRRAASLGLSGVALTEEAVRKALSESAHRDWVDFLSRQGGDFRRELLEALIREFGDWLRHLDADTLQENVLHSLLEDFEITFEVKVSAKPREDRDRASALELVRRRT